jgi:transcriptional regulator with XRE-family HTH domain
MIKDNQNLRILGKNIKAQRKLCEMTQEHLAELCEFDPTYISLLERGKRNPAFLTIVKLSKHLKCRVSELMGSL